MAGVPDGHPAAWTLKEAAREALRARDSEFGTTRAWPSRAKVATRYAQARGRISTTELGSFVAARPSNIGSVLKGLVEEGKLRPSRQNARGPGFFCIWNEPGGADGGVTGDQG